MPNGPTWIEAGRLRAGEALETPRLVLRRPWPADAEDVFARYASDPQVVRYLGWPRHTSLDQTRTFLEFSAAEWERWPAGPLLIHSRADGRLLGGTGLAFETLTHAATGYVLAGDSWGLGYATEALGAVVDLARGLGLRRVEALCHTRHETSWRVLLKRGFERDSQPCRTVFPNLLPDQQTADAWRYVLVLPAPADPPAPATGGLTVAAASVYYPRP